MLCATYTCQSENNRYISKEKEDRIYQTRNWRLTCVALVLSYIVALLSMCRRRTLCPLLYDTLVHSNKRIRSCWQIRVCLVSNAVPG